MKRFTYLLVVLLGIFLIVSCTPEPQMFTITFNGNGGSGEMQAQTATEGEAASLSENTFTRQHFVFAGWATSANGEKQYDDAQSITLSGDLTLYAVWKEAPYIGTWSYTYGEPAEVFTMRLSVDGKFSVAYDGTELDEYDSDFRFDEEGHLVLSMEPQIEDEGFYMYIFLEDVIDGKRICIKRGVDSPDEKDYYDCQVEGRVLTFEGIKYGMDIEYRCEMDSFDAPTHIEVSEVTTIKNGEEFVVEGKEVYHVDVMAYTGGEPNIVGQYLVQSEVCTFLEMTIAMTYSEEAGIETLTTSLLFDDQTFRFHQGVFTREN